VSPEPRSSKSSSPYPITKVCGSEIRSCAKAYVWAMTEAPADRPVRRSRELTCPSDRLDATPYTPDSHQYHHRCSDSTGSPPHTGRPGANGNLTVHCIANGFEQFRVSGRICRLGTGSGEIRVPGIFGRRNGKRNLVVGAVGQFGFGHFSIVRASTI